MQVRCKCRGVEQVQCVHGLEHVQVLGHGGSFGYGWTVLLEGKQPRAREREKGAGPRAVAL